MPNREIVSPQCLPHLITLPRTLNPFEDEGVKIGTILGKHLPTKSVKFGPAYEMLQDLDQKGKLRGVHTIVEASSGNTVIALAPIARDCFGIENTIAIIPPDIPDRKKEILRASGAQIEESPFGIKRADELSALEGIINPGQYSNPANPRFFERVTGPEIWEQTQGEISLFVAGVGTGGTLIGNNLFFKRQNPDIQTLAVIAQSGQRIPGVRDLKSLEIVKLPWQEAADSRQYVTAADAYSVSRRIIDQGISAGPSSGFALAGLLQELSDARSHGYLDKLRNKQGQILAVFISPDGPEPYADEYSKYLDKKYF